MNSDKGGNMTPLNTQFLSADNNDSGNKTGVSVSESESESSRSLLPPISPHSPNPLTRYPGGSLDLNLEKQPMFQQPDFSSLLPWMAPKIPSPEGSSKHHESVSMDGYFNPLMPTSSLHRDQNNLGVEIGKGEYTEYELKKIASCKRLSAMASDPKKVRKTLLNRLYVARTRQRKLEDISDLEQIEKLLANENALMSFQLGEMKKNQTMLMDENKALQIQVALLKQQEKLDDDLTEQLRGEVQRLTMEREMIQSGRSKMDPNMLQKHVNINQFNEHLTNPDSDRQM